MNIRREKFLHADGRTPSADIAGERKEVFHRDKVALLVARHLGGHLQIHFVLAGDDAYEIARLLAMKHQGLEHLVDVLAQAFGHMRGAEVVFIHLVWDEFVFHLCFVQQAGGIGLVYFFFPGVSLYFYFSPL